MMINAFTTDCDVNKAFEGGAKLIRLASRDAFKAPLNGFSGVEPYLLVDDETLELSGDKIFLSSVLISDKQMDKVIDYVLRTKAKFMVAAARSLEEVGTLDIRFKLSPVMLLHKLGLLKDATLIGGVYLDNDDVDLMVQENASLVLTPTFDAGYGFGIAPVISYYKRGLKMSLGTGDNVFNPKADLKYEADVLRLLVNASMSGQVLTDEILSLILS